MASVLDIIANANQGINERLSTQSKTNSALAGSALEQLAKSRLQFEKGGIDSRLESDKAGYASNLEALKNLGVITPQVSKQTTLPATKTDRLQQIIDTAAGRTERDAMKTNAQTAHERSAAGQSQPVGSLVDVTPQSTGPGTLIQGEHPSITAAKESAKTTTDTIKEVVPGQRGPAVAERKVQTKGSTKEPGTTRTAPSIDPRRVVEKLTSQFPDVPPRVILDSTVLQADGTYVFTNPDGKKYRIRQ